MKYGTFSILFMWLFGVFGAFCLDPFGNFREYFSDGGTLTQAWQAYPDWVIQEISVNFALILATNLLMYIVFKDKELAYASIIGIWMGYFFLIFIDLPWFRQEIHILENDPFPLTQGAVVYIIIGFLAVVSILLESLAARSMTLDS